MNSAEALYQIADELRGIANQGRYFTQNPHDAENYRRVLALSARLVSVVEQREPAEIIPLFEDMLYHVTPISGVDTAVFQDGKLLLIKRHDNGLWAMPGGAMDIGETPAETAVRELREETKVEGRVTQLLGIFDSRMWARNINVHALLYVFQAELVAGSPQTTAEATEVGFFAADTLPPLSPNHSERIPLIFKLIRGELPTPYFDSP